MIQAEVVLGTLEAFFDGPTQPGSTVPKTTFVAIIISI